MTRLPLLGSAGLPPLGGATVIAPTTLRAASQYPVLPPEVEESLWQRLMGTGLSGVAAVGNLLDLPGSMIRDVVSTVAGRPANPLDQLLSPFSPVNRVTGRELLTQFGMAPNIESGIKDIVTDPKEFGRDVAGFATEVLLDPFGPLLIKPTLAGIKGVSKALQPAASGAAALAARTRPGQAAGNIFEEGRLLANRLFDPRVMSARTSVIQPYARQAYRGRVKARREAGEATIPAAMELPEAHLPAGATEAARLAREGREMAEGLRPAVPPVERIKELNEAIRLRLEDLGMPSAYLKDVVDFSHRRMGSDVKEALERVHGVRTRGPFSATDSSVVQRQNVYKGFSGGTTQVDDVLTDLEWEEIIEKAATDKEAVQMIRDRIAEKYGEDVLPTYQKQKFTYDKEGRVSKEYLVFKGRGNNKTLEQIEKYGEWRPDGKLDYTSRGKTKTLDPVLVDRYEELAKMIVKEPIFRQMGLFTNHWIVDAREGIESALVREETAKTLFDALADPATWDRTGTGRVKIGNVLSQSKIKHKRGAEHIAERMGLSATKENLQGILNQRLAPDIAEDLMALWPKFEVPDEITSLGKMWDSFTALFKMGVLTWPARYVRDITSGMMRNVELGVFDFKTGYDAHRLLQGKAVSGYADIQAVQDWLAKTGRDATDENISNALREMFASMKGSRSFIGTDVSGVGQSIGSLEQLLEMVPGRGAAGGLLASMRAAAKTGLGISPGATLNPFDTRGFYRGGKPLQESSFGPAVVGDYVGRYTDNMNRLQPFLNRLRKGADPAQAMDDINWAQVNYSPESFTKSEQALKRLLPFYSFTSRQIAYVTRELMMRPGGRLGQIIRAQRLAGTSSTPLPEHLTQTAAIPFGPPTPEGEQAFVSGLGLMHEDALSFLGGGLKEAGLELLSRMNPLIKGPLEAVTGRSFFQRGPMGGRDISELDPTLERTLVNLGIRPKPPPGARLDPLIGRTAEQILANSPLSRLLTTARTLTDPRKMIPGTKIPGTSMVNVLTGIRISDLSPAQRFRAMRDKLDAYKRQELDARTFVKTYISKKQIAQTRTTDPAAALAMEQVNLLGRQIEKEADQAARARLIKDLQQQAAQTLP